MRTRATKLDLLDDVVSHRCFFKNIKRIYIVRVNMRKRWKYTYTVTRLSEYTKKE